LPAAAGRPQTRSVSNRVALVTGASRGLGLAFVEALLDDQASVETVIAACRAPGRAEALARLRDAHPHRLTIVELNVADEASIAAAAEEVGRRHPRLHLLLNVAGILHDGDAVQPEKKLDQVDPDALGRVFAVNAFGPLLVAKHFQRLLIHDERSVLANLSARVGSIGDDRLGGWYAYRASKAAQNMFTTNLAIELGRRRGGPIVVALHPGTVETDLSAPFRRNVPPEKLFSRERAARQLLDICDSLAPEESGAFFAWDRKPIPW